MGAEFSNPMDEAKQQRMQQIIGEFVTTFGKIFPGSYKSALIESIREGAQGEEEDERQLPDAPTPDSEIKAGTVVKKCAFMGSWKANYLVALNKADNFRVEYFDEEGGSLRGAIECCGYSAEASDQGELAPYGIKVAPSSKSRRTFYLKFESAEERDEWLEVLENACSKAEAPKNEDELLRKAFSYAYHDIRVHYGFYGGYRLRYTEAEELGELLSDILYRDVIQEVLDNVPSGFMQKMTIKTVRKFVNSSAMAAVTTAWNTAREGCKNAKGAIEEAAKNLLEPMFEQEVLLKASISEKIDSKLAPFLEDAGQKLFRPLVNLLVNSLKKIYISAMKEFVAAIKKEIAEGSLVDDKLSESIDRVHASVDFWHHGVLAETNKLLWELYKSDLKAADHVFSAAGGGYSSHDLYIECVDGIRDLTHRGVHAVYEGIRAQSESGDAISVLREVFSRYIHDAKISIRSVLTSVLAGLIQPSFEGTVLSGAAAVVDPVQASIDALPVPGLSDLFSLSSLTEEVLQQALDNCIGTIVNEAVRDTENGLESEGNKISQDNIVAVL